MVFADPFVARAAADLCKRPAPSESVLVENVAASHFARRGPVYYIKGEGEVDLVVLRDGGFVPYEIKFKSGKVHKHNLAVRNDNPAKRFVVDGGI